MPHFLPVLTAVLLTPAMALAQAGPIPTPTDANTPAAGGTPATPTGAAPAATSQKPSPAQQAVLERIRRLRDGDQRRFGNCSYRWDRWKLQPDGSRTTSYSCEGSPVVNHTIGVNCNKLQINSYTPASERNGSAEHGSWGSWRLPEAGGEEQMVATLCANALAQPTSAAGTGSSEAKAPARTGTGAASR